MSSYEYNQLLKFLYFEGYADSYAEAEELLESMSDEDFEQLLEKKDIPQEVALKIADTLKGAPKFSRRGRIAAQLRQYAVERNAKRIAKLQQNNEEVVEYLFVEGFADTIENAEVMAENISEQWIDEILNEKYVKALDTTGRGADRRAHTTDPTVRPTRKKPTPEKYKYSEAEFDSTLTSPSTRKRKEQRRQGTGGFNS